MRSKSQTLASFLPRLGVQTAKRGLAVPDAADCLTCGLLFADIAGFTPLTERLVAQRGAEGAEELARCLNRVFGELTDLVDHYGGDTLKFAGDALLAIWRAGEHPLDLQVLRATDCAVALQRSLHEVRVGEGLELSLKISIAAGDISVSPLGGLRNRWELLLVGAPLRQVALANECAQRGAIILSEETKQQLGNRCTTTRVGGGWQLDQLLEHAPLVQPRVPDLDSDDEPKLRALVPGAIRERIDAGLSEWIAELRRLTILFIHLPDVTESLPLERAQQTMQAVQEGLYRYEGSLNKLNADDKGVAVLAALGLPPFFHVDDAARGVRAACDIESELTRLGFRCSIGVTTGIVFCGAIGGTDRREYTIMGDPVNLAARLMMSSSSGVRCDRPTYEQAGARQAFECLEPITLKGKQHEVDVFRPIDVSRPAAGVVRTRADSTHRGIVLVGRDEQRARLERTLDSLLLRHDDPAAKATPSVLITGRSGMGKTALLGHVASLAERRGITVLHTCADALERGTPYHAWREIALRLFEVDPTAPLEERRAQVERTLAACGAPVHIAPLLSALLPLGEWSTEFVERFEARQRAQQTRDTLCAVLQAAAIRQPQLVIVEDIHALDSASWSLTRAVLHQVPAMLSMLSVRADEIGVREDLAALEAEAAPERIDLRELPNPAIQEIIRTRLGVSELPDAIAAAITERAEGNPRFAEELVFALRDSGTLILSGTRCRLRAGAEITRDALPPTLQAALTRRIDRLGAAEQLTLKVASVVGPEFDLAPLREIYPVEIDLHDLREHFRELERRDLAEPVERSSNADGPDTAPEGTYRFRSRIAQQVAYDLMLFSQRRNLHRKLAVWYEARGSDLAPLYSILAHHWKTAADGPSPTDEDILRALDYLERAAAQAAYNFANHDAIRFFREALELVSWLPAEPEQRLRELNLRLALGPVLVCATSWAATEVESNYQRALALTDEVGQPDQRFQALRGLWQYQVGQGDYAASETLGEQLLAVARASDDRSLLVETERMLGNNAFWLGDLSQACLHLRAAVAFDNPDTEGVEAARYGQDPEVANRGILAWALCLGGEREAGLLEAERAFERALALDHAFSLAFAMGANMWAHFFLEQPEGARDWAKRTLELTQARGFAYLETASHVVHGWAASRLDDMNGLAEIEAAIQDWRESGSSIGIAVFLTSLADAYRAAERYDLAARVLEDELLAQRGASEGWLEPFIRYLRAAIARELDPSTADPILAATAEFARIRGAHLIEARVSRLRARDE